MYTLTEIERFNQNVVSKFQIYNSVFLTLPFDSINNTGSFLPLFTELSEVGLKKGLSPLEIVNEFDKRYINSINEKEKINLLFKFIQYVERQIVLFDAIEDAAFPIINNLEGSNSLREIKDIVDKNDTHHELVDFLNTFTVRTVLTAHPTQFYPGSVLGIITDLTIAIRENNLIAIQQLLAQLGKTAFFKKSKPTPFDEAISLIWYLENVFYKTIGDMVQYVQKNIYKEKQISSSFINLGFWPGGDRDGNPFVTSEITLKVANRLQKSILKCYYNDIRKLRRKLTFFEIESIIVDLEKKLYQSTYNFDEAIYISKSEFEEKLQLIKSLCINNYQSLYLDEINDLINKVTVFGFHFASLDIRQNSKIHNHVIATIFTKLAPKNPILSNYFLVSDTEKAAILSKLNLKIDSNDFDDEITYQTIASIFSMKTIQEKSGELGSNRYIISNNESALNVLETFSLIQLCHWENPTVDIVPLFESIDDLKEAHLIMEELYTNKQYASHLKARNNKQTIMLGFSDGTKDGGYLMANWSIFKAKETITQISRKYNIKVVFFDGRGGPPSRGGGKTHKFYASLGSTIENNEIQLTVQGQTISSNFGTLDSCRFNLENLLSAGYFNDLHKNEKNNLTDSEKEIIEELSKIAHKKYTDFKNHPKFVPYLEKMSTLNYYSKTNIGSRPSKRGNAEGLVFADLRAIPFVGSWSQMKQNVPGFFGVGTALEYFEKNNKWHEVENLYANSLFFKTLLENSMMSIAKSFFSLTSYMKNDKEFGAFWQLLYDEFLITKKLLLKIAGHTEIMENYPDGKASIDMREHIVLPLLVIQQYALMKINEIKNNNSNAEELLEIYEKLVTRSLFGNTNASRNSA